MVTNDVDDDHGDAKYTQCKLIEFLWMFNLVSECGNGMTDSCEMRMNVLIYKSINNHRSIFKQKCARDQVATTDVLLYSNCLLSSRNDTWDDDDENWQTKNPTVANQRVRVYWQLLYNTTPSQMFVYLKDRMINVI